MKKYFLVLLVSILILMPGVKASEYEPNIQGNKYVVHSTNPTAGYDVFENYNSKLAFFNLEFNNSIFLNLYNDIMNYYEENFKDTYKYYTIDYNYYSDSYGLRMFLYSSAPSLRVESNYFKILPRESVEIYNSYQLSTSTYILANSTNSSSGSDIDHYVSYGNGSEVYSFDDYILTANFDLKFYSANNDIDTFVLKDFRDYGTLTLKVGDVFPQFYDYDNVFGKLNSSTITEVNLDDYEYVILNLKDYTKKDSFSTNFKVKGMVGITPVYEFGTAEKTEITDRCNLSYSDYTDYRFYVLKSDLQNNSVYYVKSCESGSSFKFDNSVFDITYVTSDNKNNPVITVNGQEYNIIPFDKLSNSANKNEEENYVPGEAGSSLTDVIDNITDYISSFWKSLTSFMSLVTKFFNTLPIEIRAVCITTFTVACVLGLLKIIKS